MTQPAQSQMPSTHDRPLSSTAMRVLLVPVFVLLCYCWDWAAYRAFCTTCFVEICRWLGIAVTRLSLTAFAADGHYYRFVVACTAIDAYCGSIPLLWERQWSFARSVGFFVAYFIVLTALNLLRLTLGFYWFSMGGSWLLTHEVMAGLFYFGLFLWISHRRAWSLFAVRPIFISELPSRIN